MQTSKRFTPMYTSYRLNALRNLRWINAVKIQDKIKGNMTSAKWKTWFEAGSHLLNKCADNSITSQWQVVMSHQWRILESSRLNQSLTVPCHSTQSELADELSQQEHVTLSVTSWVWSGKEMPPLIEMDVIRNPMCLFPVFNDWRVIRVKGRMCDGSLWSEQVQKKRGNCNCWGLAFDLQ